MQQVHLCRRMPAREAVSTLALVLLKEAQGCEAGILQGADIEYLHQYRVNLRKARALISLLKGVYPALVRDQLKARLGELAKQTNELRDLDVYLAGWPNLQASLPGAVQPGLNLMLADFKARQSRAKAAVDQWLVSPPYADRIDWLLNFFSHPAAVADSPAANEPVAALVSGKIKKRYKKICRLSRTLDAGTPDAQLHALRIECKKLRYLLAFFGALIDKKATKKVIKRLKKLQDILGAFNDCAVQQRFLQAYGQTRTDDPSVTAAVQALQGQLATQQHKAHRQTLKRVSAFAGSKTAKRVKTAFT